MLKWMFLSYKVIKWVFCDLHPLFRRMWEKDREKEESSWLSGVRKRKMIELWWEISETYLLISRLRSAAIALYAVFDHIDERAFLGSWISSLYIFLEKLHASNSLFKGNIHDDFLCGRIAEWAVRERVPAEAVLVLEKKKIMNWKVNQTRINYSIINLADFDENYAHPSFKSSFSKRIPNSDILLNL